MSTTLKCAGAFTGTVTCDDFGSCTVGRLQDILRQALGCAQGSAGYKLIAAGRTLQEEGKLLSEYGVNSQTRLLVMPGSSPAAQEELSRQEHRALRLERLKSAAEAMARRTGRRADQYELALENQDGTPLKVESKEDRQALVIGLALHERGSKTLAQGRHSEALDELLLAEEAFALCRSSFLESTDNLGLLLIDIVWCYFSLGRSDQLAAARDRLRRARQALARAHGPQQERLHVLHGNFCPELALYLRLDLLEGVSAFHAGAAQQAKVSLEAARAKWERLQVGDAELAALTGLGFSVWEATRALRFCDRDADRAAEFALQQRQKAQEQEQHEKQLRKDRKEQRKFGTTGSGELIDLDLLRQIVSLGFDRLLAGEALRQADNKQQEALDMLLDPERSAALQLAVPGQQPDRKRPRHGADDPGQAAGEAGVAMLVSMGFAEPEARQALAACGGEVAAALDHLQGQLGLSNASGSGQAADQEEEGMEEHAGDDPRDEEMEAEIAAGVSNDPLAAYDVDVGAEGQAILEYLSKLQQSP